MKRNDFKVFDLLVFSILAVGFEFLGYYLVGKLETPIYLSFSFVIGVIAMVRWGVVGVIPFILAGIPLLILKEDINVATIAYEVIANAFIVVPFLFLTKKKKDLFVGDLLKTNIVFITCILSVCCAKGFVLVAVSGTLNNFINYFAASLLVIVMNALIFSLLSLTKSEIIKDMNYFLSHDEKQED